ncbi:hypothetical protein [Sphingopyxis sp. R3-92]
MTIHHGKHQQAYIDNLNKAATADDALKGRPPVIARPCHFRDNRSS